MAGSPPPKSRGEFEIAIICALPFEAEAVYAIFDEFWDGELGRATGDSNVYATGRIGAHNVVVASMSQMGKATSSTVAARIPISFPSIRLYLVVGVRGGVPISREREDILLGDIVISTGLIQFDFGRRLPNNHSFRSNTSAEIERILQREEFRDFRYPGRVNDRLYQATYRHKHHNADVCSICAKCHSKENEVCHYALEASCHTLGCSDDMLVPRDRSKSSPVSGTNSTMTQATALSLIHFGRIASGDQVMKCGQERDEISKEEGVIAFEMEGAGVWANLPTLVVKAVCDYADCHKSKIWQPYAAVAAAACTKALLKEWRATDKRYRATDLVLYEPHQLSAIYSSCKPREAWPVQRLDRANWPSILSRISDYDHEKAHRMLRKQRLGGTTDWFLQHLTMQLWLGDNGVSAVACHGIVGCGKTIICTRVVDHLNQLSTTTGCAVIQFYCDMVRGRSCSAKRLLASLMRQLLEYMEKTHKSCPENIKTKILHFFTPSGPEPDSEDLADIFSDLFLFISEAWYVLDGLDQLEPEEIEELLECIYPLLQTAGSQKLFIACREQLATNVKLSSIFIPSRIYITTEDTEKDIDLFIRSQTTWKMDNVGCITDSSDVLNKIKTSLFENSRGMFLWVKLQIDAIWLDCKTNEDIEASLQNLPRDLNTTYLRCLKRIPESEITRAYKILRWITCATRTLFIDELQEAISFTFEDRKWTRQRIESRDTVKSSCLNLIAVDKDDLTVSIIHPSMRKYLCELSEHCPSCFHINFNEAELKCGEECINYLTFSDFGGHIQRTKNDKFTLESIPNGILSKMPWGVHVAKFIGRSSTNKGQKLTQILLPAEPSSATTEDSKYAFLNYARQNWPIHTRAIEPSSQVWEQFENLAFEISDTWSLHPWRASGQSQRSNLHGLLAYSTRTRHLPLLKLLRQKEEHFLKQICNLPLVDESLPALHVATRLGFKDVVEFLLDFCQADAKDYKSRTALDHAVEKNHIEIVQMLIPRFRLKATLGTAMNLAASYRFEEMVISLLEASHLGIPSSLTLHDVFITAAISGWTNVIEVILSRYNRKIRESLKSGAISLSASNKRWPVVAFLLRGNWVDLRRINRDHSSLLLEASCQNQCEVIELLLQRHQVNVNTKDSSGQTALILAAQKDHREVVRLLLKYSDIIVDTLSACNCTALTTAVEKDHREIVELLLQHSSTNVNHEGYYGTALQLAARDGHGEIVQLLLKHTDIDVNIRNQQGTTALLIAAQGGHEEVVKLLLKHSDIDVNQLNLQSMAMLSSAPGFGEEIAELVAELGEVNANRQSHFGSSALLIAIQSGHGEVVKLLLEHRDIKINFRDSYGNTALTVATLNNREEVVKLLLQRSDIDVNLQNIFKESALIIAARRDFASIVVQLLERTDIDVNLRKNSGDTALTLATKGNSAEVVKLLLARNDVNVNVQNGKGNTALMIAVAGDFSSIVIQLLKRTDIDINLKNDAGYDALAVANKMCHHEIASKLMERGYGNADGRDHGANAASAQSGCKERPGKRIRRKLF